MTVAVLAVLVVHNLITNLWAADRWYVRLNLATAGVVAWLSGAALPVADRPLEGVAAALVVLAAGGLLVAIRSPLLCDRRMAGIDAKATAWRALVRIPLGTVVLEEVAFRAVLPALLSPLAACALFGLWHVLPTATALERNGLRPSATRIAAAVAATTAAGLGLWELRELTGGLLAPALVHWAANGGGTVAAYLVMSRRTL